MLGKLLRYDIKNIGRLAVVAYALIGVLAFFVLATDVICNHISQNTILNLWSSCTKVVFYLWMGVSFILIIVNSLQYYKKNLLQDEGYLMNTLPVSPISLVSSKLVACIFWMVISLVVCYLGQAVVAADFFWAIKPLDSLMDIFGKPGWLFCLSLASVLLAFYICIVCAVFLAYSVAYTLQGKSQSVRGIFMAAFCVLAYIVNQNILVVIEFAWLVVRYGSISGKTMEKATGDIGFMIGGFLIEAVCYLILAGIYYAVTVRRMTRNLNLD